MTTGNLAELVESFADVTVVVLGEAMLDTYLEGVAERLCREAPVPVVDVTRRNDAPGGAANVAANVAALGGRAVLVSATGDDPEGSRLRDKLGARGVDCSALQAAAGRRTLTKSRVAAGAQLLVRFDDGTTSALSPDAEERLLGALSDQWHAADAVVVSDYAYGILTPRVIEALARLQRERPRVVVADSRDLRAYRRVGVTAVKPNFDEALALLRAPAPPAGVDRGEWIAAHAPRLLAATGADVAAVTVDCEGAVVVEEGQPPYRTYPAAEAAHGRASGGGDTFAAGLALALASGAHTPAAAELAQMAASVAVGKDGTATCSLVELRRQVYARQKRVADLDGLISVVELSRAQGRRVVFTNGCFDILHRGHITYLNQAKALGDLLVVGVNTDDGVARLKGPDRPINSLEDRMELLSALSCVDYLVPFGEDRPDALIRSIRPDVFVKGGDYSRESLPEAPLVESLGGEVRILPFVHDRSTTSVIERIRALD